MFLLLASAAAAQETRLAPSNTPAAQQQQRQPQQKSEGFFDTLGRWLDESVDNINSTFKGAKGTLDTFGKEAGAAARSTADVAKDAADAVARIPGAKVISGHEICPIAPNGAPDCAAAATAVCKAKGFSSGKSVDFTTAEKCPARVLLSGRGACTTETFVSRALCQ
jgi:hypothetical protein